MLKPMLLSEVALTLNGRLVAEDCRFSGVSIDSRVITKDQLFIALTGPRFNGHDYLNEVEAKGAVAALVERGGVDSALPQLIVKDTRIALGQLGALNRANYVNPVAAITGSSGKTTVKEMMVCILRTRGLVLATKNNLNNELGVPLTLLELTAEHTAAVIELGASRRGEISYTVGMTKPHVAVLNNAGTAHMGEFGGPEKIVEAKGEILEGLGSSGTAVLNLDDKAFGIWQTRLAGRKVLSFSLKNPEADFYASDFSLDARGCQSCKLHSPLGTEQIQLNLLGSHNVANALAAAAAAYALNISLSGIKIGLEAVQPAKGRAVTKFTTTGLRIIDDTYNANPTSMCAAVDVLANFPGRTVLVLGDISELGEWAEQGHREVGAYAAGKVSALYAVGPMMAHTVSTFGYQAHHFANQADLIMALRTEHEINTTILIKGSRSAAMENIVVALCDSRGEKY